MHTLATRLLAVPACCLLLLGCMGSSDPAPESSAPEQQAAVDFTPTPGGKPVAPKQVAAKPGAKTEAAKPAEETRPVAEAKPAAQEKAGEKTAADAKPAPAAAAPVAAAPASRPTGSAPAGDAVHQKLDVFAQKCVAAMNRQVLPSKNKKEVVKNSDGTYTCRYIEVDPSSVKTSYKTPESSKAITYVGYLTYDEAEYACQAPTQKAAQDGPFKVTKKASMTELVKYVKNDWSY